VEYKYWPHPADVEKIEEEVGDEEATIQAITDGSKKRNSSTVWGCGFKGSELVAKLQQKLDNT